MDSNFTDALAKTMCVLAAFFLTYFFLPYFLTPLDLAISKEPVIFLQQADIRPQKFAYMASVLVTTLMVLLSLVGFRINARLPQSASMVGSRYPLFLLKLRQLILKFVTFLRSVDLPPVWGMVAAIVFLIIAVSFSRHSFGSRTGVPLFVSDSHAYLDFAGLGEMLVKGKLSDAESFSVYGIGAAAIYAALREIGFSQSYRLIYDLTWGFNIAFLFLWGSCLLRMLPRRPVGEWFGIILILGACILVPPLISTKQELILYPTLSATRYVPFLLLFIFLVWSPERINIAHQLLAAVLAFIGLCFAPDVGVVAVFGYTAGILLDRKIDYQVFLRTAVWLFLLVSVCFVGATLFYATLGYDLAYSIKIIFTLSDRSSTGLDLFWTGVGLLAFASAVFTIILVGPHFFYSDMPKLDRIAFIAAGMILIWGIYFMRRPSEDYWIYNALLLFILIFFASKVQQLKIWHKKIWPSCLVLILFATLADEGIHWCVIFYKDNLVTQIREYQEPKMELAGIKGPENWVRSSASHMESMKALGEETKGKLVAITGQPYLATMFATKNTVVFEGRFSLGRRQLVVDFVDRMTLHEKPVIAIDGPGSPQVFQDMGDRIVGLVSNELVNKGYRRVSSTVAPDWVVFVPSSSALNFSNSAILESAQ